MAAIGQIDELVKEYMLFRGFPTTLRAFEVEQKTDREKGFRVDRIVDQFIHYITNYDLANLRDYWTYLDRRLFSRLEQCYSSTIRKLEVSLLRYYLVNAIQNSRQDKVVDFFKEMTAELQNQPEWKDWFVLPFVKSPEENQTFQTFFSKAWQDTFLLSLHNFLNVIFQSMSTPPLINVETEYKRIMKLQEENEMYRQQIAALLEKKNIEEQMKIKSPAGKYHSKHKVAIQGSMELMDEFYNTGQDLPSQDEDPPKKAGHTKSNKFFPSFKMPSPKLGGRKSSNNHKEESQPSKVKSGIDSLLRRQKSTPSTTSTSSPVSVSQPSTQQQMSAMASLSTGLTPPTQNKMKMQENHERQRRELLGKPDTSQREKFSDESHPPRPLSNSSPKRRSVTEVGPHASMESRRELPSSFSVNPDHDRSPRLSSDRLLNTGVTDSTSPFLLLSQDEYCEHLSSITHCRFSSTGHTIASADIDGVVKVWTMTPSPETMATIMCKSGILSIEWASNIDRLLLLGNKISNVRVYDVKEKKTVYEATINPEFPRIVSLSHSSHQSQFVCSAVTRGRHTSGGPDLSGSRLGKLLLWDMKTMKQERELPLTPGPVAVNCTSYNHNGHLLISGAADGIIRIYDMRTNESIAQWNAHIGDVYSVQFSPDENSCYSMGSDGKFHQWSVHKNATKLADLPVHKGAAGPFVLTGYGGYKQSQTPKGKLFAFDGEGQYVLTCQGNSGLIYKLENYSLTKSLELSGHKSPLVTVDWSSATDCKMCLTGAMDGRVRVSTFLSR